MEELEALRKQQASIRERLLRKKAGGTIAKTGTGSGEDGSAAQQTTGEAATGEGSQSTGNAPASESVADQRHAVGTSDVASLQIPAGATSSPASTPVVSTTPAGQPALKQTRDLQLPTAPAECRELLKEMMVDYLLEPSLQLPIDSASLLRRLREAYMQFDTLYASSGLRTLDALIKDLTSTALIKDLAPSSLPSPNAPGPPFPANDLPGAGGQDVVGVEESWVGHERRAMVVRVDTTRLALVQSMRAHDRGTTVRQVVQSLLGKRKRDNQLSGTTSQAAPSFFSVPNPSPPLAPSLHFAGLHSGPGFGLGLPLPLPTPVMSLLPSHPSQPGSFISRQPGGKKTTEDVSKDIEALLAVQSVKEREKKKMAAEISELLSNPTAKEKSVIDKFKTKGGTKLREFCPHGTKEDCRKENESMVACEKVHWRRIINLHTDVSLGDCSYLDTCRHTKTCKFIHYEIDDTPEHPPAPMTHPIGMMPPHPNSMAPHHPAAHMPSLSMMLLARAQAQAQGGRGAPHLPSHHLPLPLPIHNSMHMMPHLPLPPAPLLSHPHPHPLPLNLPHGPDHNAAPRPAPTPNPATPKNDLSPASQPNHSNASAPSNPPLTQDLPPAQWINCDVRKFPFEHLGKFGAIMADPPWDIHMELPYGTLSDEEMRTMPLQTLQDDGLIFLWVTGRAMETARECLTIWGYKRIDEIVWVKTNQLQRIIRTGRTGHWINHSKEHCLVGIKGNPNINRNIDCDVIVAEVRETSRKPDEIYGMIERITPGTRKIEIFARPHNIRSGWLSLGNQLDGNMILDDDLRQSLHDIVPLNPLPSHPSSTPTGDPTSAPAPAPAPTPVLNPFPSSSASPHSHSHSGPLRTSRPADASILPYGYRT
mmetsp:Transcript_38175/g.61806  ORF Transcript_38175/g.61806 Transcript_38175/m.61806 type:complete len:874 (-) Transcript_38175:490-3111(-)|eukprot:CAMPEP_0184650710 /NCGR_PEP_ID=MMETSP0308-20130426/8287_1 /TAXON_ID=38269 /ORGANISM="Gloeochaete witrockiana, Strain SAG 46.84" /LENGTH=873 /DNA_ID=CAMNT_0027084459 /DNA_START=45 /DNA_END=2666 /DNA_ORIENTATION=-